MKGTQIQAFFSAQLFLLILITTVLNARALYFQDFDFAPLVTSMNNYPSASFSGNSPDDITAQNPWW